MTRPWFKRFGVIGYRPITSEGYLVVVAMGAAFLAGAVLWLNASNKDQGSQWIGLIVAAGAAIVGHIVILTRME